MPYVVGGGTVGATFEYRGGGTVWLCCGAVAGIGGYVYWADWVL